jgi:hypothetical protein
MATRGEGRSVCRTVQPRCISVRGVPTKCESWHPRCGWEHHTPKPAKNLPRAAVWSTSRFGIGASKWKFLVMTTEKAVTTVFVFLGF